jgi:tetratricopeptide (TPR) repeat protein
LDPDQPTVAVAGLLAAWKAGRFRELIGYSFDVLRRLNAPATRELFLAELHLWWLLFWWVLGAAWVVGSVAVWGSALLEDLRALLLPGLPLGVSRTVLVLFLGLPLLFPGGAAWLLLWLSIWLWPYHDRWGKGAIALFWLATALVPSATDGIRERVDFALQPAVRAIQAFSENRLYGGFLSDLLVLRAALPQEPRALELFADVHRTMGQWELARDFYNRVLEREPSNFYALLNLGGYYFRKGDFGKAITFYRKAAEVVPSSAAAQFNLSTTYSENYLFDEARAALEQARKLDAASVDAWIRTPPPERVVVYNGSLVRKEELKSVLASNRQMAGKGTTSWRDLLPRVVPAVVSVVAALLTMGVSFWWRVRESSRPSVRWEATPNRWIERFLPPIAQLASGSSLVAFAQLTLLVALALLPLLFGMMVGLPWGGYRPRAILVGLVTLALVVSLALRQALRSREA